MAKKPASDPLRSLMLEDLARSGLDADTVKKLRLKPLTPAATRAATGGKYTAPAYAIPYFELSGKVNCFSRLRFLEPVYGFAEQKPRRYWQAAGSPVRAYFPPLVDWSAIAADPKILIYLTEGEKKAAAATAAGFPTVGLGGVWSWTSSARSQVLIPDLEAFVWQSRQVVLVFDSDPDPKPEVAAALARLARTLEERGAIVRAITLPAEAGRKVGLDDYLVAHTAEAFAALPQEEIGIASELVKMNAELAYIIDIGCAYAPATRQFYRDRNHLVGMAYADRVYTTFDATGKVRKTNVAAEWLAWPRRRTYTRLTYAPGKPLALGDGSYNLWRGWPAKPRKGDVSLFLELVDHVFSSSPREHRDWFLRWAAYPIQHPGAKLYTAVVICSNLQGVGKTLLGVTLGTVYGAENYSLVTTAQLHGAFNDWQQHKQLIVGEEVTGTDKRTDADTLKHLITGETVHINQKYKPVYTLPNLANFFFTTNHPDAFLLDIDDRRYFIIEIDRPPPPPEFFAAYDAWLKSPEAAPALFHYFLNDVDTRDFNPRGRAPVTTAKQEMIDLSGTECDRVARELRESPDTVLRVGGQVVDRDLFTLTELVAILDIRPPNTPIAFSRALRRAGFRQLPITKIAGVGGRRLWAVRNREHWEKSSHADRVAEYTGKSESKSSKF